MASTITVQLYTISVLIGLASAVCPCSFVEVHNMCYRLSLNPSTWNGAWKECANKGGFLAEFTEHLKIEKLFQFLETIEGNQFFWLGATDAVVHGDWRWMKSGHTVSIVKKHWCPRQALRNGVENYHTLLLDAQKGCLTSADPSSPVLNDTAIGYICEAHHVEEVN